MSKTEHILLTEYKQVDAELKECHPPSSEVL